MKNQDPMLDAIEEILAKAKSYSDEPLMQKLKSKMVIAVEKPEEKDAPEDVEIDAVGSDAEDEEKEDREKVKAVLSKLFS